MDDILSIAYLGLVKAYKMFDPTEFKGENGEEIKFSTYAIPTINGNILRELRDYNSVIRVNRDYKGLLKKLEKHGMNGTEPMSELMKVLSKKESIKVVSALRAQGVDSLDRPLENEDKLTVGERVETDDSESFEKMIVKDFISTLPPALKQLYMLRMEHGLSQSEASKAMGVAQVSVSRYERSLLKLAEEYGKEVAV
jgi:RNA polymerase sporulation-specific sigma factor